MGFILCLPTIPERGSFPGVCGMPSSPPLEKFSLSQQVSSANSVLVRGGALCPLPFSVLRLCLVQVFCALSQSLRSCVHSSVVSGWCSYLGVFHQTFHLRMSALKTHCLHVVQSCVSVLITVYCVWVSANPAARRVAICVQQEGSPAQQDSVTGVGSTTDTGGLFKHSTIWEKKVSWW